MKGRDQIVRLQSQGSRVIASKGHIASKGFKVRVGGRGGFKVRVGGREGFKVRVGGREGFKVRVGGKGDFKVRVRGRDRIVGLRAGLGLRCRGKQG